uniref:threonine--tRNA ligase n=1 Tax=Araucaria cunninghamii TaxID=56994 RepID=A0A0D6QTR8_ARACU
MGFASSSYRVHRMAMVTSVLLQPTLSQSSNPARKLLLNLKSGQCAGSHLSLRRSRGVLENPYGLGWIRILSANRIKCKRLATIATLAAPQEAPTKTEGDEVYKQVVLPTNETSETLVLIRHTSAHVLAMAVQKAFPNAKVTIGPWIERGFYYDFDMQPVTDQDLKKIKKEMDRIINRNLPLIREEVSRQEAERRIKAINEPYKLEILESIKSEPITIYHIGDEWWDLCAGPHVESTGQLNKKAIELESVAGAYWRGDEKRPMLQRIYGTAWESEEQLKAYQFLREEAKRRDHRRLGQELDLFSIQEEAGGGLVFWHPKGAIVRHHIEDFWKRTHIQHGYELLYTPHVAKADLWRISGHLEFYKENMFDQMDIEDELYQLRPMNCPYHILIYKNNLRSYRDLPFRVAELGTVYRYEMSGSLHGLFRVRGFTQDDAHVFCLPSQIKGEIRSVLDLTEKVLSQFGFKKYEVNLSTKPEKAVGPDDIWEKATSALEDALKDKGWAYSVDEGGGAFYGPKIDLKIEDALGRKWQCSTVQVDFNLPHRFDLSYVDTNSEKSQPIMIHRAILGSLERFFGILIENYAGDFPLWLSPVQARLLPVTDTQVPYCQKVVEKMKEKNIRAEVSYGERLSKLIRNAETQKVPLMAVVGPKEVESETLTVRTRHGGELGTMKIDQVIEKIEQAVTARSFV